MNRKQPIPFYVLLGVLLDVARESQQPSRQRPQGQTLIFRAIGYRVEGKLEISVYYRQRYLLTITDEPEKATAGLAAFIQDMRSYGLRARVKLTIKHPDVDLPF